MVVTIPRVPELQLTVIEFCALNIHPAVSERQLYQTMETEVDSLLLSDNSSGVGR